jgi:hypothetical protein
MLVKIYSYDPAEVWAIYGMRPCPNVPDAGLWLIDDNVVRIVVDESHVKKKSGNHGVVTNQNNEQDQ